jgi:hypothetical protein
VELLIYPKIEKAGENEMVRVDQNSHFFAGNFFTAG